MSDINVIVNDEIVNIDVIDEPVLVNVINSPGVPGAPGAPGVGVPVGGTTGQVLKKLSNTNYDTYWAVDAGGISSIGLTMPSAFAVANSPLTANGTLAVTGAGTTAQYIRGDGQLANFPSSVGGGSAYNYYLNGSVNQGTFGGDVYYEMSKTPVLGAGTNFTRTNAQGNGYIASFITDAGDPSLLNIPAGNWNVEFYFQANSNAGNPQFYAELYKVDASNNFTLVGSGSTNPEGITNGTTIDQYYTAIPVPQTSLLVTDRLAIRIYVIPSGRTITLHTENSNLCEILTTLSTGLNALNGLTAQVQYFATGTSGTDFGISSATDTHTFNLPTASALNRGALSSADWTTFNNKVPASRTLTINGVAFDLSADRSWTVSGGISGSGASGQVAYWDGTTSQAGNANFLWDNTNSNLAIGAATTWQAGIGKLSVVNGATDAPILSLKNTDAGKQVYYASYNNLNKSLQYIVYGSSAPDFLLGQARANAAVILGYNTPSVLAIGNFENVPLVLGTNNAERMRIFGGGNVGIGTGSTDGGQRLQVQGTTLLNGNVTFSSSTGMTWDATNSRLGIGTNAPVTQLNATSSFLIGSTLSNASTTAFPLQVNLSNTGSNIGAIWRNASATGYATFRFYNDQNSGVRALELGYSGSSYSGAIVTSGIVGESGFIVTTGNYPLQLGSNNTARAIITGGGNILLNSSTDSGERLQVTGTMKVTGNVALGNGFSWDSSNQNLIIGNNAASLAPTIKFNHSSTQGGDFTSQLAGVDQLSFGFNNLNNFGGGTSGVASGRTLYFYDRVGAAYYGGYSAINGWFFGQSSTRYGLRIENANSGITAMTIKANGRINMSSLPTSPTGLATGDLWNDAGTIKIV